MMTLHTRNLKLEYISVDRLEHFLAVVGEQGWSELVLLGPNAIPKIRTDSFNIKLIDSGNIYMLNTFDEELPRKLARCSKLKKLNIAGHRIGDSGIKQIVGSLHQLIYLDSSANNISDLGAEVISDSKKIEFLYLAENFVRNSGLQKLSEMSQLRHLDISDNNLTEHETRSMSKFVQLVSVNLRGNNISAVGVESLSKLSTLTALDLGNNRVGAVEAHTLAQMLQLTYLDLSHNMVGDEGASALSKLEKLTFLRLEENAVGDSGVWKLSGIKNLKHLNLTSNNIGPLGGAAISNLSGLRELQLCYNNLGDRGIASLPNLPQLESLSIRSNNLSAVGVGALCSLKRLHSLYLSENDLRDQGAQAISALKQLVHLDLGYNNIGDFGAQALSSLSELKTLDLTDNIIEDDGARHVSNIANLVTLKLGFNNISDEGATVLSKLYRLKHLDLRSNRITNLRCLALLLKRGLNVSLMEQSSAQINVYGCPIVIPPEEVVFKGRESVLNYLEEIDIQSEDYLCESKVLLLGKGEYGKTSLYRRLYTDLDLPLVEETTRGIDIYRHSFSGLSGRSFWINVWDFGGQQIYHATHQFFLTRRSLYILLDDTRHNDTTVHDEGFKYWLEAVETLADSSPVLVFQNEKGGRSKAIDQHSIKGRFPNVKEFYAGDLANPESVNEIRKGIEFHIQALPHVMEKLPTRWVSIRRSIEEISKTKPYISQDDYFDIYCEHLGPNKEKSLFLSQYLHDLGIFLHFQDDLRLYRTVFLQNEWITNAVYRIIDDEIIKKSQGRFTLDDCRRLWNDELYKDKHNELVYLMEKFELCYILPDVTPPTWLVPQLLPPEVPNHLQEWSKVGDLKLFYRYNFLPRGMLSRLIVRNNGYIQNLRDSWAQGALFEYEESQLLVSVGADGRTVEFSARGTRAHVIRYIISSNLDKLNDTFEGLKGKVDKRVPCNCEQCRISDSPHFYSYKMLVRACAKKAKQVQCQQSFIDVPVFELLDGLSPEPLTQAEVEKMYLEVVGPAGMTSGLMESVSVEAKESLDVHQSSPSMPIRIAIIALIASIITTFINLVRFVIEFTYKPNQIELVWAFGPFSLVVVSALFIYVGSNGDASFLIRLISLTLSIVSLLWSISILGGY